MEAIYFLLGTMLGFMIAFIWALLTFGAIDQEKSTNIKPTEFDKKFDKIFSHKKDVPTCGNHYECQRNFGSYLDVEGYRRCKCK
jgi:hypothetical protein